MCASEIDADFSYANQLEFFEGKATGEVNLPFYFFGSPDSICGHSYCKTNALQCACEKYSVQLKNCMAVGDSRDDRCMVGHAGKGVAFCTKGRITGINLARRASVKTVLNPYFPLPNQ